MAVEQKITEHAPPIGQIGGESRIQGGMRRAVDPEGAPQSHPLKEQEREEGEGEGAQEES